MEKMTNSFDHFWSIFGPFLELFWRHFVIIFRTSFSEASWHAFGFIFGPFWDQVGPEKQGFSLRGGAISRFLSFFGPFFFESVFGAILEDFGSQNRPKNRPKEIEKQAKT